MRKIFVLVVAMLILSSVSVLADSLCTITAGTPTLGLCADNGCQGKGGVCKAVDTDNDNLNDDCQCKIPPPQPPAEVPEFTIIGAGVALLGAGYMFVRSRSKVQ